MVMGFGKKIFCASGNYQFEIFLNNGEIFALF